MRPQDLGQKLANQARGVAFNDSRPRLAKVTNVTNWETVGIRAVFEDTAEVIACEARGAAATFEIAVNDYVWVERIEGGKQNKWRVSGFAESSGVFVPTVRTVSLPTISSLDASDGSPTDVVAVGATGITTIGDGTNEVVISATGTLTLNGTAQVVRHIPLELAAGGGTATIAAYLGGPSIVLDADTETIYASCAVPYDWDQASDWTIVMVVVSEITEDAADRVSITAQVASYYEALVIADVGQAVAIANDEQPEADTVVVATGTVDFNHGTYPLYAQAVADNVAVRIKLTANLAGANECTGPLHVLAWWIEYTADRLGEATT